MNKKNIRNTDYDRYEIDMKCPLCDSEYVEAYYFHGTWIYVCEDCTFMGLEYVDRNDLKNLELFEKLRSTPVDVIMDRELEDDNTDFGGIAFAGETVRDFVEDYYPSIWDLNHDLTVCGIKPIEEW